MLMFNWYAENVVRRQRLQWREDLELLSPLVSFFFSSLFFCDSISPKSSSSLLLPFWSPLLEFFSSSESSSSAGSESSEESSSKSLSSNHSNFLEGGSSTLEGPPPSAYSVSSFKFSRNVAHPETVREGQEQCKVSEKTPPTVQEEWYLISIYKDKCFIPENRDIIRFRELVKLILISVLDNEILPKLSNVWISLVWLGNCHFCRTKLKFSFPLKPRDSSRHDQIRTWEDPLYVTTFFLA